MKTISIIEQDEFACVNNSTIPVYEKLAIIADMCRLNTLSSIKIAGSGHLGSSFSAMDIVVSLYYCIMNTVDLGIDHPDRDIYFSSKGHDVPGLYSVLHSIGVLPLDKLIKLRRLDGLDGHPDVKIPGIECNSGSLGMGISKARGMMAAKRLAGRNGRVFVLTGDGEFQEGQIFEALQITAHHGVNDLVVIIDHNKIQSDRLVQDITSLGNLESKLKSFGWHVERCDGHNHSDIQKILQLFKSINDRPKILIADTIKGRGISFMEHPYALSENGGLYRWHSGAPDDDTFSLGFYEIMGRINTALSAYSLTPIEIKGITASKVGPSGVSSEYVAAAFGQALVNIARERDDIVVLDADLAADCRIREFERTYPDRFIENGIAEQDMVSMAGGLALEGFTPVVNSFSSFLCSRANEQIYTNACEKTGIVYVGHYSGLIPAGPGLSHQSIRDISLMAAIPGIEIIQPCNSTETAMALEYCLAKNEGSSYLRLIIGPSPGLIDLPGGYRLEPGKGIVLSDGKDAVLFAYGPVMLHEALQASILLAEQDFSLKVVNMPWLNRVDTRWLKEVVGNQLPIYVLEDHGRQGGLGDFLINKLAAMNTFGIGGFQCFGVEGLPACGTPQEVLHYYGLDGSSIAKKILADHNF